MDCVALRDDWWEQIKGFVPGGPKGKRAPRTDIPFSAYTAGSSMTAHSTDLDAARTLMDRPEGRSGSIDCNCCGSPANTTLAPSLERLGQQALELPRADHAHLVNDQNLAGGEYVTAVLPAMFQTGDSA